jgi:probable phosphoglycerate mutase
MLQVLLVRHAQTAANAAGRFAGREDTPLSEAGRRMAAALAGALAPARPDALWCSPLRRARDTVAPLAAALGLTARADDGLVEQDCGRWTGRTRAEVQATDGEAWARFGEDPERHPPPGGEAAAAVVARATAALERARAAHPTGRLVVVSHKGTLRLLLATWLGIPLREHRRRLDWPLCGVTRVDWTGDGPLLRAHADVSWLPLELRAVAETG